MRGKPDGGNPFNLTLGPDEVITQVVVERHTKAYKVLHNFTAIMYVTTNLGVETTLGEPTYGGGGARFTVTGSELRWITGYQGFDSSGEHLFRVNFGFMDTCA
jgi:hypothetical protein